MKSFLWMAGAGNDLPSSEGKKANTQEKRSRFAQDASVVAAWDFERIIPSHGDSVEQDAKHKFLMAFSRVCLHLLELYQVSTDFGISPRQYLGPDGKAKI
jgi:hypothetical protein